MSGRPSVVNPPNITAGSLPARRCLVFRPQVRDNEGPAQGGGSSPSALAPLWWLPQSSAVHLDEVHEVRHGAADAADPVHPHVGGPRQLVLLARAALPHPRARRDAHLPRAMPLYQDGRHQQPVAQQELIANLRVAQVRKHVLHGAYDGLARLRRLLRELQDALRHLAVQRRGVHHRLKVHRVQHAPRRKRELHHWEHCRRLCVSHKQLLVKMVEVGLQRAHVVEIRVLAATDHIWAREGVAHQAHEHPVRQQGCQPVVVPGVALVTESLHEVGARQLVACAVLTQVVGQADGAKGLRRRRRQQAPLGKDSLAPSTSGCAP
mmetsp:Transcript_37830/g.98204  ORF Transcript_37830/g.98204 Transcript_37830/m.98204 type:complete len:321 (+) Transcript_37830:123-1085(+)